MGAFVLEFAVDVNAHDEAAVAKSLPNPRGRTRLEIGGGEIFRFGVGPVADGREPAVGDLGGGGTHLVVRCQIEEKDANLDEALVRLRAGGEPDGSDNELFAAQSPPLLLPDVGDGD